MKYMLDTNICIYIIKKHPPHTLKKFTQTSIGEICISSITLAELEYGVAKSQYSERNHKALQDFILPLMVLPFNTDAAAVYGKLCTHLERKGLPIGPLDLMIAAHAKSLELTLITNNQKEFSRVPHLKIANWAE